MFGMNKTILRNWPRSWYLTTLSGVAIIAVVAYAAFVRGTFTPRASATSAAAASTPCPRPFTPGSVVQNPPALFSSNGVLNVTFSYEHRFDTDGTELLSKARTAFSVSSGRMSGWVDVIAERQIGASRDALLHHPGARKRCSKKQSQIQQIDQIYLT
jgi:hypothetical protein